MANDLSFLDGTLIMCMCMGHIMIMNSKQFMETLADLKPFAIYGVFFKYLSHVL